MGKDEGAGFGLEGETEVILVAALLERRNFRVCSVNHFFLNTPKFYQSIYIFCLFYLGGIIMANLYSF